MNYVSILRFPQMDLVKKRRLRTNHVIGVILLWMIQSKIKMVKLKGPISVQIALAKY